MKYSGNAKLEYAGHLHDVLRLMVGWQGYYQRFEGLLSSGGTNVLRNWRVNAYSDLSWSILSRVKLQTGVRVERNQLVYSDNTLKGSPLDVVVPYASLSWSPDKSHRVRLHYRRWPYSPSAWSYAPYARMADSITRYVGSPTLKAYYLDRFALGYTYRLQENWMRLQGFYTTYSNAIYSHAGYESDGVLVHRHANGGSVMATGVSLSGSISLFGGVVSVEPSISTYYQQYAL